MNDSHSHLSIRDLNRNELRHVTRAFARRVGLDASILERKGEVASRAEVLEALALDRWPDASATITDLMWCSESLRHKEFSRLSDYSVHWQKIPAGLRLWIAQRPEVPSNDKLSFDEAKVLEAISDLYRVRISNEAGVNPGDTVSRRKFRRRLTMVFLFVFCVALIAVAIRDTWCESPVVFFGNLVLRILGLTILVVTSSFVARRLEFSHGVLTIMVLWLFGIYFTIVIDVNTGAAEIPSAIVDAFALAISTLPGFIVYALKNPRESLGEATPKAGWNKRYLETVAGPSLIVAPTFATLKIIEYILVSIIDDPSLVLLLVPAGGLAVVALLEFMRREIARNGTR